MQWFLRLFSRPVTRWPAQTLAVILIAVAIPAFFLPSLALEVDLTEFRSDSSASGQAMSVVEESFIDTGTFVQVVLDAGDEGNVLSEEGIQALYALDEEIVDIVGDDARLDSSGEPWMRSIASATHEIASSRDVDIAQLADPQLRELTLTALRERSDLAELTSTDLDLEQPGARAVVSIVMLDPDLSASEREAVSTRLQDSLDTASTEQLAGFEAMVISESLFEDSIQSATQDEAPLLFGTALIVIIGILGFMFRSVRDTAIGLSGLVLTIVATFGIAGLLGPAHLGITGPMSQLAVLVPVLIIGLGVDFAVHLTTRYREQLESGDRPRRAASRSLHTVGAALVLASAATVIGFGANAVAPLQITADFAIQVAVGILVAFLVMGFLVPAAGVLLDRRKELAPIDADQHELRPDRIMEQPANFALKLPLAGAILALVFGTGSLIAATDLDVSFDRDDFVPAGSHAEELRDRQDHLFGGQLDDVTYIVVEGDLTNPDLVNAMVEAEARLADVDGVATISGEPQVRSVTSMLDMVLTSSETQNEHSIAPSLEMIGWDRSGFTADANLNMVYVALQEQLGTAEFEMFADSELTRTLLRAQTTAGDAGAGTLRAALLAAYEPVESAGGSLHITSDSMIMSEMSDELAGFQLQSLGMTLIIVLLILVGYYGVAQRMLSLGIIAMIPAVFSASLLLGTMWILGITVNAVTATMTAIAVGIGVPYGVHVVNRFSEELLMRPDPSAAVRRTLQQTGRAIAGSGFTTLGAFIVLAFANVGPIQQLGLLGAFGIAFALVAALFIMPGVLVFWARRQKLESPKVNI